LSESRNIIRDHANLFRSSLRSGLENNLELEITGEHHITGVNLPERIDVLAFEGALRSRGFFLKVSQYPSRPREKPCARIAFNPFHSAEDVFGPTCFGSGRNLGPSSSGHLTTATNNSANCQGFRNTKDAGEILFELLNAF